MHRRATAHQGVGLEALTANGGVTEPATPPLTVAWRQSDDAPANTCWNSWLVMPPWLGNWMTAALLAVDPPATSMARLEFLFEEVRAELVAEQPAGRAGTRGRRDRAYARR